MKKIIALFLVVICIISLTSCFNKAKNPSGTESTKKAPVTTTEPPAGYVPPEPTAYLHNTFASEYIEFYYKDFSGEEAIIIKGCMTPEDTASLLSVLNHVDIDWIFTGGLLCEKRFFFKIGELRVCYAFDIGKLYEPYFSIGATLSEEYRSSVNSLMEPYINESKNYIPYEGYEYNEELFWAEPEYTDVALADRIEEGMTYSEVVDILGTDGFFFPRPTENMVYSIRKFWRLSDEGDLRILFEDSSPDYTNPYDVSNMDDWMVKTVVRSERRVYK